MKKQKDGFIEMEKHASIPTPTLGRIVTYLHFLRGLSEDVACTSATAIASELGLNPVLVRKDLAMVSSSGRPKVGYMVAQLVSEIEDFLGYENVRRAVLVGAGNLGKALLASDAFDNHGFQILAGFDTDPDTQWSAKNGKPIYPMAELEDFCLHNNIHIGIITVPPEYAQRVCDQLTSSGIRAIWNFTSANLSVPDEIAVKNEDLTVSLALLSKELARSIDEDPSYT